MLGFAFVWASFITVWAHGDAIDLILTTWGTFGVVEFAEWAGNKISARRRWRRFR